jgi:hypothetical protein
VTTRACGCSCGHRGRRAPAGMQRQRTGRRANGTPTRGRWSAARVRGAAVQPGRPAARAVYPFAGRGHRVRA